MCFHRKLKEEAFIIIILGKLLCRCVGKFFIMSGTAMGKCVNLNILDVKTGTKVISKF